MLHTALDGGNLAPKCPNLRNYSSLGTQVGQACLLQGYAPRDGQSKKVLLAFRFRFSVKALGLCLWHCWEDLRGPGSQF